VLDLERNPAEKRAIVQQICASAALQQLHGSRASVMIFATRRFAVGTSSWHAIEQALWKEAATAFSKRGGSKPVLRWAEGSTVTGGQLKAAGARVELLYLSDQIELNATGSAEAEGGGRIEGLLIRALEGSHGVTAEQWEAPRYRAAAATGGRLLNSRATARGCGMEHTKGPLKGQPVQGMWGAVSALVLSGGWEGAGLTLWDGDTRVRVPQSEPAAKFKVPTFTSTAPDALRPNGDAWRLPGETNEDFCARACAKQREWSTTLRAPAHVRAERGAAGWPGPPQACWPTGCPVAAAACSAPRAPTRLIVALSAGRCRVWWRSCAHASRRRSVGQEGARLRGDDAR
jgi:hypothetical protein